MAPQGNALRRLNTLASMAGALIKGGQASLQSIGRHMDDDIDLENSLFLPQMYITKQAFGPVNVLYWHDKTRYERPLYLLTSLEYGPQAEAYYRKRYHIETFFGDIQITRLPY